MSHSHTLTGAQRAAVSVPPPVLDDAAADLGELAGLINFRIGAWQDFGYAEPPTPEYTAIPPLGKCSARRSRSGTRRSRTSTG